MFVQLAVLWSPKPSIAVRVRNVPPVYNADLAQLVVHLICNQGVGSSNLSVGTIFLYFGY